MRYILLGLLCLTNFLSVYGFHFFDYGHKPAFPIVNLVHSIARPYSDRIEDVVTFLKKEASADQSLLVFDYEYPLMFYTGMQIIDARFTSSKPIRQPDWIMPKCISCVLNGPPVKLPDSLMESYIPVEIEVHDTKSAAMLPEPDSYEYFTAKGKERFIVYKRKSDDKIR